ncbi:hypothetical protein [Aquimarina litoralis]|uniref:hypothetical protein n=1 Tax=Aquimarina litoralis TaxID=584605 RepID=UPI001C564B57|nr:hypothetical protein [Aquimarina litoralis]MBW1295126.1 hypothetical protein [Aquimarina litoralis]
MNTDTFRSLISQYFTFFMDQYLSTIGIKEFKNATYTFQPKVLSLFGQEERETLIIIDSWELGDGYRYLIVNANVDDEWITLLSASYKDQNLFDKTKIGDRLGKYNFHDIDLLHWDSISELESYFYTTDYDESIELLKRLLEKMSGIVLEKEESKDLTEVVYEPFKALQSLKRQLIATVTDFSSMDKIEEAAIAFMETKGADYRSDLYEDSKLILPDNFWENKELEEHFIHEQIEEFIQMNFEDDEIFFEDFI